MVRPVWLSAKTIIILYLKKEMYLLTHFMAETYLHALSMDTVFELNNFYYQPIGQVECKIW
jgi:hypothetical protein